MDKPEAFAEGDGAHIIIKGRYGRISGGATDMCESGGTYYGDKWGEYNYI